MKKTNNHLLNTANEATQRQVAEWQEVQNLAGRARIKISRIFQCLPKHGACYTTRASARKSGQEIFGSRKCKKRTPFPELILKTEDLNVMNFYLSYDISLFSNLKTCSNQALLGDSDSVHCRSVPLNQRL